MSSQKFEIDTAPHDIGFDEFYENYFEPEKPVVIRGIGPVIERTDDLTIDSIRKRLVETGLAKVNTSWFEGPAEMLEPLAATPEIVSRVLKDSHRRENHCRLWLNGAGNVTPSHYDGNLLYVFNLQLRGRKEWRIVSPHTPLRSYPFSRGALFKAGSDWPAVKRRTVYCDLALEEGDMIYLPPLWHHAVKATAESNININWVATTKAGATPSKARTRELELLRWARFHKKVTGKEKLFDTLFGAGIKDYMKNFGGVGWSFVEELTKDVKLHKALLRIPKEIAFAGFAIKDMKKLKRQLKKRPLDSLKDKKEEAVAA